jgi:hypothetical protein
MMINDKSQSWKYFIFCNDIKPKVVCKQPKHLVVYGMLCMFWHFICMFCFWVWKNKTNHLQPHTNQNFTTKYMWATKYNNQHSLFIYKQVFYITHLCTPTWDVKFTNHVVRYTHTICTTCIIPYPIKCHVH